MVALRRRLSPRGFHLPVLHRNRHGYPEFPQPGVERSRQKGWGTIRQSPDAPAHLLDVHGADHKRQRRAGAPGHTSAKTTLEFYIRSVPEPVRIAVESLDQLLKKVPDSVNNPN